jgi:hypothetical protein
MTGQHFIMTTPIPSKNHLRLIPVLGILVFVVLYVLATFLYPGGSNAEVTTTGFDWLNNYWCDLMGSIAKNGAPNTARPIALMAMFCLCASLAFFWYDIPRLFKDSKFNQVLRYAGIASMAVTLFLFTDYHDTVIHIAGLLGLIALTGVLIGLHQYSMTTLFGYGVFCFVLMLFNYFIYETHILLSFLPIIQKITFVLFLFWICLITIYFYQNDNSGPQKHKIQASVPSSPL